MQEAHAQCWNSLIGLNSVVSIDSFNDSASMFLGTFFPNRVISAYHFTKWWHLWICRRELLSLHTCQYGIEQGAVALGNAAILLTHSRPSR